MTTWEPVIGLEVHVQLATKSKIFSGAATRFGAAPNAQACAVDLGLPGTLPVLNADAVRMAIMFGLAVDAQINLNSVFERKNYFYPDLPKGYQISQFAIPIVGMGTLHIPGQDGKPLAVRITRAHLEEDAGKSVHDVLPGLSGIDLNRAGTPLLEVVSEPDLRNAADAATYFRTLWSLVRSLGICDGQLQEGSMRCDANVSVRPVGASEFGVRTEIKNINSFRFVERAINYEIERQIDVLERGGSIQRETRLYDAERNETRTMRLKEDSEDYRYFPDPDLLPLSLDAAYIEAVRDAMPELPAARAARYERTHAIAAGIATALAEDPDVAAYFEAACVPGAEPKVVANWIVNDLAGRLNSESRAIAASPVTPQALGTLAARIADATLSSKTAKTVFDRLWSEGGDVDAIIDAAGLRQLDDREALAVLVRDIVDANPNQVAQYQAADKDKRKKLKGFFVGQIMKRTEGKANPKTVDELLIGALEAP
ncbi:MAG: Asp-tRNA(Asn)/Glu-tRNA(Gln) amidotransferase subunit GatB [Pseudomonadales bacterium]|nr:Asp-tRNA(Asn)/Glu-tRNA(Gln) amidotransferase subunit GatB [Pseudomonadales bacterium]MCP5185402.1 Asp-tRNA(Asn)/Glu-tRNA(Gln) amidotransferase subunit GatB [Pseudomonadales bacterium]